MVKRIAEISLFLIVFLAAYGGLNYYVYFNLVQAIPASPGISLLAQTLFILLACAYPVSQLFRSRLKLPLLACLGALWLGVLSISVAVFVVKDLLSLFLPIRSQAPAIGIIIVLTLWSAVKAWRGPEIKDISIKHKKLARPFSIVHLSDLHLGPQTSLKWLEKVIAQVNSLEADIVVVTGDLADDTYEGMAKFIPAFKSLKTKDGVYAVSGNHEHYQGIEHFRQFCRAAGIIVADGQFLKVTEGVNLAGMGGKITGIDSQTEDNIRGFLTAAKAGDYNILLIHHPVGFKKTAKLGIDLQLSGHTHQGQILPLNLLVHLVYRYAYGLHALGDSHIYISSGTGTWGPPLRLGSSSEIVRIEVS